MNIPPCSPAAAAASKAGHRWRTEATASANARDISKRSEPRLAAFPLNQEQNYLRYLSSRQPQRDSTCAHTPSTPVSEQISTRLSQPMRRISLNAAPPINYEPIHFSYSLPPLGARVSFSGTGSSGMAYSAFHHPAPADESAHAYSNHSAMGSEPGYCPSIIPPAVNHVYQDSSTSSAPWVLPATVRQPYLSTAMPEPPSAASDAVPGRSGDGKFVCLTCHKAYGHPKYLKRHSLRREYTTSNPWRSIRS